MRLDKQFETNIFNTLKNPGDKQQREFDITTLATTYLQNNPTVDYKNVLLFILGKFYPKLIKAGKIEEQEILLNAITESHYELLEKPDSNNTITSFEKKTAIKRNYQAWSYFSLLAEPTKISPETTVETALASMKENNLLPKNITINKEAVPAILIALLQHPRQNNTATAVTNILNFYNITPATIFKDVCLHLEENKELPFITKTTVAVQLKNIGFAHLQQGHEQTNSNNQLLELLQTAPINKLNEQELYQLLIGGETNLYDLCNNSEKLQGVLATTLSNQPTTKKITLLTLAAKLFAAVVTGANTRAMQNQTGVDFTQQEQAILSTLISAYLQITNGNNEKLNKKLTANLYVQVKKQLNLATVHQATQSLTNAIAPFFGDTEIATDGQAIPKDEAAENWHDTFYPENEDSKFDTETPGELYTSLDETQEKYSTGTKLFFSQRVFHSKDDKATEVSIPHSPKIQISPQEIKAAATERNRTITAKCLRALINVEITETDLNQTTRRTLLLKIIVETYLTTTFHTREEQQTALTELFCQLFVLHGSNELLDETVCYIDKSLFKQKKDEDEDEAEKLLTPYRLKHFIRLIINPPEKVTTETLFNAAEQYDLFLTNPDWINLIDYTDSGRSTLIARIIISFQNEPDLDDSNRFKLFLDSYLKFFDHSQENVPLAEFYAYIQISLAQAADPTATTVATKLLFRRVIELAENAEQAKKQIMDCLVAHHVALSDKLDPAGMQRQVELLNTNLGFISDPEFKSDNKPEITLEKLLTTMLERAKGPAKLAIENQLFIMRKESALNLILYLLTEKQDAVLGEALNNYVENKDFTAQQLLNLTTGITENKQGTYQAILQAAVPEVINLQLGATSPATPRSTVVRTAPAATPPKEPMITEEEAEAIAASLRTQIEQGIEELPELAPSTPIHTDEPSSDTSSERSSKAALEDTPTPISEDDLKPTKKEKKKEQSIAKKMAAAQKRETAAREKEAATALEQWQKIGLTEHHKTARTLALKILNTYSAYPQYFAPSMQKIFIQATTNQQTFVLINNCIYALLPTDNENKNKDANEQKIALLVLMITEFISHSQKTNELTTQDIFNAHYDMLLNTNHSGRHHFAEVMTSVHNNLADLGDDGSDVPNFLATYHHQRVQNTHEIKLSLANLQAARADDFYNTTGALQELLQDSPNRDFASLQKQRRFTLLLEEIIETNNPDQQLATDLIVAYVGTLRTEESNELNEREYGDVLKEIFNNHYHPKAEATVSIIVDAEGKLNKANHKLEIKTIMGAKYKVGYYRAKLAALDDWSDPIAKKKGKDRKSSVNTQQEYAKTILQQAKTDGVNSDADDLVELFATTTGLASRVQELITALHPESVKTPLAKENVIRNIVLAYGKTVRDRTENDKVTAVQTALQPLFTTIYQGNTLVKKSDEIEQQIIKVYKALGFNDATAYKKASEHLKILINDAIAAMLPQKEEKSTNSSTHSRSSSSPDNDSSDTTSSRIDIEGRLHAVKPNELESVVNTILLEIIGLQSNVERQLALKTLDITLQCSRTQTVTLDQREELLKLVRAPQDKPQGRTTAAEVFSQQRQTEPALITLDAVIASCKAHDKNRRNFGELEEIVKNYIEKKVFTNNNEQIQQDLDQLFKSGRENLKNINAVKSFEKAFAEGIAIRPYATVRSNPLENPQIITQTTKFLAITVGRYYQSQWNQNSKDTLQNIVATSRNMFAEQDLQRSMFIRRALQEIMIITDDFSQSLTTFTQAIADINDEAAYSHSRNYVVPVLLAACKNEDGIIDAVKVAQLVVSLITLPNSAGNVADTLNLRALIEQEYNERHAVRYEAARQLIIQTENAKDIAVAVKALAGNDIQSGDYTVLGLHMSTKIKTATGTIRKLNQAHNFTALYSNIKPLFSENREDNIHLTCKIITALLTMENSVISPYAYARPVINALFEFSELKVWERDGFILLDQLQQEFTKADPTKWKEFNEIVRERSEGNIVLLRSIIPEYQAILNLIFCPAQVRAPAKKENGEYHNQYQQIANYLRRAHEARNLLSKDNTSQSWIPWAKTFNDYMHDRIIDGDIDIAAKCYAAAEKITDNNGAVCVAIRTAILWNRKEDQQNEIVVNAAKIIKKSNDFSYEEKKPFRTKRTLPDSKKSTKKNETADAANPNAFFQPAKPIDNTDTATELLGFARYCFEQMSSSQVNDEKLQYSKELEPYVEQVNGKQVTQIEPSQLSDETKQDLGITDINNIDYKNTFISAMQAYNILTKANSSGVFNELCQFS